MKLLLRIVSESHNDWHVIETGIWKDLQKFMESVCYKKTMHEFQSFAPN